MQKNIVGILSFSRPAPRYWSSPDQKQSPVYKAFPPFSQLVTKPWDGSLVPPLEKGEEEGLPREARGQGMKTGLGTGFPVEQSRQSHRISLGQNE